MTSMGCKKTRTKMNKGMDARLSFQKCQSSASKAVSEIQPLCVVETLLVMLSLGGSQTSLCHLCVKEVMKKLADPGNTDFDKHLAEHEATLDKLKKQYFDILKQLEAQKLRGKELEKVTRGKSLLDAPIDDLNLHELEILQSSWKKSRKTYRSKLRSFQSTMKFQLHPPLQILLESSILL